MVSLFAAVGCSSSGETAGVSFEQSFSGPTQVSVFAATGEAVDRGLICSDATGTFVGNEDEEGNALTEAENDALYGGSERFIAVTVEVMSCDDGSGDFTFRVFTEIDPTDPDYTPGGTTWTITGGTGYETISGEGDSSLPEFVGDGVAVWTATGDITRTDYVVPHRFDLERQALCS